MITDESNRNLPSRKGVKIGDFAIIHWAANGSLIKAFFNKTWLGFLLLCAKQYVRFSRALSALQMWSPFRYNPGYQTIGLLSIIASIGFQVGLNSTAVLDIFKPFGMFFIPVLICFKSPDEIYDFVWINVESQFLLGYTVLFTCFSAFHLITIWTGGNKSLTKRGESLIMKALSKSIKLDEFVICGLIEPLLFIAIGFVAWKLADDALFFGFTLFTSLSEFSQQILDRTYKAERDSIVRA
ncbi:MAG: hypothetical protein JJ978_13605 [Roseivirga sp.]|uniref:hypothetical protein n=1 Tax=Roseivirga sp. TaxID=1964215 RepID=UPI001B1FF465|nr:hypothetical protein [Roseivirga sp.]MBO6496603.1 hypothetical protein [Roseivirga sp.]